MKKKLPHSLVLTRTEQRLFTQLDSPTKIQDFLNSIKINFEKDGDTCHSPRTVIRTKKAHCLEGALLAAAALWYHGQPPLLLDLKASKYDFDHVVALFKKDSRWGAISKTNHAVLRYREPVYKTIRELALSFFHEYFNDNGQKTLRSYSGAFDLRKYGTDWITSNEHQWDIGGALDDARHFSIISPSQIRRLRRADPLEIKAGKLTDYKSR